MADDGKVTANAEDAQTYWVEAGFSPGGIIRQVDYPANSRGLHPSLAGIKIVDCDTHFSEPPDLFTSRAPARLKDRMPYYKDVNGRPRWYIGDKDFGWWGGGNVVGADHNKLLGRLSYPSLEESHPACYQVAPRLKMMDEMGVHAQICFQNSGVTQAGSLMALGDDEIGFTILKIYNDAAMERERESGERLFTLGHLPLWNKKEMDAEARRCIDMGIKGFVLPDTPERYPMVPSYTDLSYWGDFLSMCEASGRSLNFHLNAAINPSALTWKSFAFEQTMSIASMMMALGNAATIGNWMVSGLLDTYPKLKIGMIESGMGWVPFCLEALEHDFDEMVPKQDLQKRPWEYFKDNFWVTYWFERLGPKSLLETLGVDKVLFETDFPHPTSLYPGVQEHLVDTLGGYDFEVRRKVLERNAVELYNLPF
ncbi:MAG: amidohydrolase family protein [Phenylobacterium sp.]